MTRSVPGPAGRLLGAIRPGAHGTLNAPIVLRALEKGLGPALRGTALRWRFGEVAGPVVFVGKSVRLVRANQLRLGRYVFIGDGTYIDSFSRRGVSLSDRVTLREHSWIQCTSSANRPGEGLVVGASTYFGPGAYIGVGGLIEIGERCQFGPRLSLIAESHLFRDGERPIYGQGVSRRGIHIGDDCWFGANVTVLDGVRIGRGVVVGANSLVLSDIEDGAVAYGTPASVKRQRGER